MFNILRRFTFCLGASFGLIALSPLGSVALAAEPAAIAAPSRPDVRVLVDISGSMKQSDPQNLRRPAVEMLVNLYPQGARGGIWSFAQGADVMVPLQPVSDSWREAGRRKAATIPSTGLFTNIPLGLEKATADIVKPDPAWRTSVILLTDGMVDISKSPEENAAAREHLLKQILPKLRERGVTVHTVALSKQADRELMQRLAVDTGGLFAVAETAEKLNKVFLQAFDAAAPAEQLPITDNQFLVDGAIDELTALIFHKPNNPVALLTPDQQKITAAGGTNASSNNVKWFKGPDFDLITIKKPAAGKWKLESEPEPGTRITIVSNLSLAATRLPESLFINNTAAVTAALKEQEQQLTRPELLKLATFKAKVVRRGDGKEWGLDLAGNGSPPTDGYYRAALPMLTEVGTYDIAIDVDGKTFQRSQKQTVMVRENFIIKVATTETLPPAHTVTLFAQNPEVVGTATKVTAHIKDADGKVEEKVLAASSEREWQLAIPASEHSSRREVSFAVTGQYRGGEEFAATTQVVAVDDTGGQVVAGETAKPKVEEHAPTKAAEPAHEEKATASHAEEAKADEHAAEPEATPAWKKWALYAGLALGNLLVIGLGYMAYRMVMGGSKSKVLDDAEGDDEDGAATEKAGKGKAGKDKDKGAAEKPAAKAKKSLDLDLPDDAIDIDPASDNKK